eukprot:363408-Chlamydomonas_euryale.AAC.3
MPEQGQRVIDRLRTQRDPYRGNVCPAGATLPDAPCPAGYYCPNVSAQLVCPEGYFCKQQSVAPRKCGRLAACPEGTAVPAVPGQALLVAACIALSLPLVWLVLQVCGAACDVRVKLGGWMDGCVCISLGSADACVPPWAWRMRQKIGIYYVPTNEYGSINDSISNSIITVSVTVSVTASGGRGGAMPSYVRPAVQSNRGRGGGHALLCEAGCTTQPREEGGHAHSCEAGCTKQPREGGAMPTHVRAAVQSNRGRGGHAHLCEAGRTKQPRGGGKGKAWHKARAQSSIGGCAANRYRGPCGRPCRLSLFPKLQADCCIAQLCTCKAAASPSFAPARLLHRPPWHLQGCCITHLQT